METRILLVEDNEDFARVLGLYFRKAGYQLDRAEDGEKGLELALSGQYALIILDIGLPKRDGLEVLEEIRKSDQIVPVLMLTHRSKEMDKVVGLDLGADDYVTKPFSAAELMARVDALLRRAGRRAKTDLVETGENLDFGTLQIDLDSRRVILDGEEVDLTPKEFEIVAFLASHPGQAFSREELLDTVWEYGAGDYAHVVNNTVMRIRKKIGDDPTNPRYIKTVRGFGYRFATRKEL